jgi:hypothetical protein
MVKTNKKKGNMKKIRLPPTNLKGVETYLRRRGYRIGPALENDKPGAKLTFDKPLPDGRRIHGEVHDGREVLKIKQHIDKSDPYRDPIGHILNDCTTNIRNSWSVVPKRKQKGRRKKRAYT